MKGSTRLFKRILSSALALLLTLTCCLGVFAAEVKKSITLDANGGVCEPKVFYTDSDVFITNLPQAKRTGYEFTGWYADKNLTGDPVEKIKISDGVPGTLYAGWRANEYSIHYDYGFAMLSGNEIINNNPDKYPYGTDVKLSDASCAGYTFEGWYTDSALKSRVYSIAAGTSGAVTLYAKWSAKKYNINYVLVNSGINISSSEVDNPNPDYGVTGESITLKNPTCPYDGYSFAGWYTDSALTSRLENITKSNAFDLTLHAKWVRNEYTVTYDYGVVDVASYTVSNPNPSSYVYETAVPLSAASTSDPAYTFDGWYTDSLFTSPVTELSASLTGDITLYAKWTENVYNITYILTDPVLDIDIKYVSNPNPSTRSAVGDTELKSAVFDREYYRFNGWYTDKQRTNKVEYIPDRFCGDITLYASWGEARYYISYDYGELNEYKDEIVNENITEYVPLTDFTFLPAERDGYVFNGWFSDPECTVPAYGITVDMTGDKTFYASYTEKTYTISYVLTYDGCGVKETEVFANNPELRTTSEKIILSDPVSANVSYMFAGWYLDPEFNEEALSIPAGTAGNVTLYAKWNKIITYIPVWGDATLSNGLGVSDARLVLRYVARLETFSDDQKLVSDINNDGKITATDVRLILRLAARLENIDDLKVKYSLGTITAEDGKLVIK